MVQNRMEEGMVMVEGKGWIIGMGEKKMRIDGWRGKKRNGARNREDIWGQNMEWRERECNEARNREVNIERNETQQECEAAVLASCGTGHWPHQNMTTGHQRQQIMPFFQR